MPPIKCKKVVKKKQQSENLRNPHQRTINSYFCSQTSNESPIIKTNTSLSLKVSSVILPTKSKHCKSQPLESYTKSPELEKDRSIIELSSDKSSEKSFNITTRQLSHPLTTDKSVPLISKAISNKRCAPSATLNSNRNSGSFKNTPYNETPKRNNLFNGNKVCKFEGNFAKTRKKECPPYKVVLGTPFAVDAFCYGDIPDVKIYFLTHFHSDHYVGLRKSFNNPIFCTKITGDLCKQKLYVNDKNINILKVNKPVDILGIKVTALDANHCPGSVMLFFALPSGKNILHCGDFRATHEMESCATFWNHQIQTVYLDTTYCHPRYDFPTQSQSIDDAILAIKEKKVSMIECGRNPIQLLIICGTYTIGKEKFFMDIAESLRINVWAAEDKNKILKTAVGKDFSIVPAHLCHLHVLSMMNLNFEYLENYYKKFGDTFIEVLAFKPTGWEHGKLNHIQKNNVTIQGIPYSEHSSFIELQRFVKFIQPQTIIPTVFGKNGTNSIQKYFSCCVGSGKDDNQSKVSDFFKAKSQ